MQHRIDWLMVDTLQEAMEDALVRQQFYADGEVSYQDTVRSNAVFDGADVKAYVLAPDRPHPVVEASASTGVWLQKPVA